MKDINSVSAKTMQGASLMILRTLVLYPIGFLAEVGLSRFLQPQDFGIYAMASFVTVILAGVLEVGLTASLTQRIKKPSQFEFQILFSLQLLVISLLVFALFLLGPNFFDWLKLDPGVRWIMLVLLICPWVSGIGAMSQVQLERKLRYPVFAKIDILRGFSYCTIAVLLAFYGWGVWSFVVAIIISTIVRTAVAFHAAPWTVRFRLNFSGMEKTLRSGFLFQASTITSLFRDHIGVILAGPLFGPQAVGYLNWAKNMTFYTSQVFTQVVSRVTFPSISRIQKNPTAVQEMVQATLKYINILTFPIIFIFAALIPEFVAVIFTSKWTPAIPVFYFYSIRMLGSNITTVHISVLNGLGHIRTSLRILSWWTFLDWIFAGIFCFWFGFHGVAIAYAISVIPISIWLLFEVNRWAKISFYQTLYIPLLVSGSVGFLVWILKTWFEPSWLSIGVLGLLGMFTYIALLFLIEGQSLLKEIQIFLRTLSNKY